MSVTVAGTPVTSLATLSETCRLTLALVDGGREWFDWASSAPGAYVFPDEGALIAAAQHGLHGAPLMLIPSLKLIMGPARLMALAPDHLRSIALAAAGDSAATAEVPAILAAEELATQADLAAVDAWLAQVGVAGEPLFQSVAFEDRLALAALIAELGAGAAPTAKQQKQGAAFAAGWARSPVEFADHFRAWKMLVTGPDPIADPAKIGDVLTTLQPLLFGALDCPSLGGFATPVQVAQAVQFWIQSGRQLGFARLSLAVAQLIVHGGFRTQTGDAARALVDRHLATAQAALADPVLDGPRWRQDGAQAVFGVTNASGPTEIAIDATGTITLLRFEPAQPA